jgi:hypothetical protein
MWKRPPVPRTARGPVRNDAASPLNFGTEAIPATPRPGSAGVVACVEVDIPATAISGECLAENPAAVAA